MIQESEGWGGNREAVLGWGEGGGIWMQLEEETTRLPVDDKTESREAVALPPSPCRAPTPPPGTSTHVSPVVTTCSVPWIAE